MNYYHSEDHISVTGLKIQGNHGVYDFEKENGQLFIVDAKLYFNMQHAGMNDALDASVNYALVCETIKKVLTENVYDLIEKVAEKTAVTILDEYTLIDNVIITVSKPQAPVDMNFDNISVTISRGRHQAYIAYGSNMGDSEDIIRNAIKDLDSHPYCKVKKESSMLISSPYGDVQQDNFHNGVIMIETYLEPFMLLKFLNDTEKKYGRQRLVHWGPRTLDLDIVLYDHAVINTECLTIPHSDMANRDFVLGPLAEIAPYYIHPVTGKSILQMSAEINEKHIL